MLGRVHSVATFLWTALAGGAAAGFLARDALALRQPLVALAWLVGAAIPVAALARRRFREGVRCPLAQARDERGQASVEFVSLALLASIALGALAAASPRFDGRSFGGFLTFRIVCTIERNCHEGDSSLTRAYGASDAALVRELAPNLVYEPGERQLPVDWRDCRRVACAEARDEPDLDVQRTRAHGRRRIGHAALPPLKESVGRERFFSGSDAAFFALDRRFRPVEKPQGLLPLGIPARAVSLARK